MQGPANARGTTTGTSTTALAVLAAIVLTAGGTWWVLREDPASPGGAGVDPEEWTALRKEVASLRREVELLREDGRRLSAQALPIRREAPAGRAESGPARGPEASTKDPGLDDPETGKDKGRGLDEGGWAAVQRMRSIEDPALRREQAEALLHSEDFWARHGAVMELLEHDPATALAALHELLATAGEEPKGEYAAVSAIEALGQVEGYAVDADLRRIHADADLASIERAAARSLEQQGDPSLMLREIDGYRRLLDGDDVEQRLRGIELLGRTRSPSAVAPLLPLLASPDVQVRLRAVQALGRTGSDREIAALEAMLDDPVAAVRDQAVNALARLRGEQTGK